MILSEYFQLLYLNMAGKKEKKKGMNENPTELSVTLTAGLVIGIVFYPITVLLF